MSKNLSSRLGTSIAIVLFSFSAIGCSQKKGINNSNSSGGIGEAGRKVIYRDRSMIADITDVVGTIVMSVCVDRLGNVVSVELNEKETTISDHEMRKNALRAMANYKYEAAPTAPEEECGKFTVSVDNWKGIK